MNKCSVVVFLIDRSDALQSQFGNKLPNIVLIDIHFLHILDSSSSFLEEYYTMRNEALLITNLFTPRGSITSSLVLLFVFLGHTEYTDIYAEFKSEQQTCHVIVESAPRLLDKRIHIMPEPSSFHHHETNTKKQQVTESLTRFYYSSKVLIIDITFTETRTGLQCCK